MSAQRVQPPSRAREAVRVKPTQPPLEVQQGADGRWWWQCNQQHSDDVDTSGNKPTQPEAFDAALAHCAASMIGGAS